MVITLVRNVIRTLLECRQDRSPGRPVPQSRPVCLARNPGPFAGVAASGLQGYASWRPARRHAQRRSCRRRATMIRRPLTMKKPSKTSRHVLKTELAAGSSDDCLTVSNSLKPKRLSDIEVSPATECALRWGACSHAG
jgi:hypothetical protein